MSQRTVTVFLNACKSEYTRKTYLYNLTKFKEYYRIKDLDSLLTILSEKIQEMLEDYVIHLKSVKSPNSIPTIMAGIVLFFEINRVTVNKTILHKLYPEQVKPTGERPYTINEISKMLSLAKSLRNIALVLFLTSGVRAGSIPSLKLKDVSDMPEGCKAIKVYEGSKQEYTTYLTPESSKALEAYWNKRKGDHEVLHDNSPVFRTHYRIGSVGIKPLTYSGIANVIYRLQERAGISKTKMGKRHDIQVDHGFRKFFETTLVDSGVDPTFAEMMMSHTSKTHPSMPTYVRRTTRLFDEYKKAILNLTIDDSERLKLQNRIKDEKISMLESEKDVRITQLENEIVTIKKLLKQAKKD